MDCQDKTRRSSVPSIINQSASTTACQPIPGSRIAPPLLNSPPNFQPPPHGNGNNEEGVEMDGDDEEEDLDDEDCEIDDDGDDDVDDEDDDEEASQHSLCEYFHHNTQLATTGTVPISSSGHQHHHHNFGTFNNGHPAHHLAHQANIGFGKHLEEFTPTAHHGHSSTSAALGGLGVNRKRAFSFAASTSTTASVGAVQTLCDSTPSSTSAGSGSGYIQHASSSGGHASSIGSVGSEKRAATKICRVCGDKAYSYNFNVITCESCKAFFRRNANKEKEIRCPFSEQCDINIVSRRFCQRCRLQKCFRVGMKKEWIMSDEQRMEKKLRIQANRQRRLVERQTRDTAEMSGTDVSDVSVPSHLLQMHPPMEIVLPAAISAANASGGVGTSMQEEQKKLLITEVLNAEAALQHSAPVATTQPSPLDNLNAALVMNASTPIQQQIVAAAAAAQALNAHFGKQQEQQMAAELLSAAAAAPPPPQPVAMIEGSNNLGPSAMTTTTTFCSPSTTSGILQQHPQPPSASVQPPTAPCSSVLGGECSPSTSSIIDVVSSHLQQQPPSMTQLGACEEAAAAALANAAVMQQQLNAAQHVVQQLVVEELVAKQQVAAAVAQQQYQQQQLAAAVAVAAASSILQQQQQADAAVVSAALAHAQVAAESQQSQPSLSSAQMDSMQPTLQPPVVADTSGQVQPVQTMQTQPEQELIAVPKDVLIKLVEHKIENEQRIENEQQHQMELQQQSQAPPPLKCQCRCQCGRYSSEELIVDRVMTDLLNPCGDNNRKEVASSSITIPAYGANQVNMATHTAPDEAMDTAPPPPTVNHDSGEKESFTG